MYISPAVVECLNSERKVSVYVLSDLLCIVSINKVEFDDIGLSDCTRCPSLCQILGGTSLGNQFVKFKGPTWKYMDIVTKCMQGGFLNVFINKNSVQSIRKKFFTLRPPRGSVF